MITLDKEAGFRELFQRFVENQQLSPEAAEELLQKILNILFPKHTENKNNLEERKNGNHG